MTAFDDLPAWRDIQPRIRHAAERVLTPRELDALKLSLDGAGRRRIAAALGIHESTARDLLRHARDKLADALDTDDQEPAA